MKEKTTRYYSFKTFNGEIITIRSDNYFKAEAEACKNHRISEYVGWSEQKNVSKSLFTRTYIKGDE